MTTAVATLAPVDRLLDALRDMGLGADAGALLEARTVRGRADALDNAARSAFAIMASAQKRAGTLTGEAQKAFRAQAEEAERLHALVCQVTREMAIRAGNLGEWTA